MSKIATKRPKRGRPRKYSLKSICQGLAEHRTHQNIADYLGCSRQTVTYGAKQLKHGKL